MGSANARNKRVENNLLGAMSSRSVESQVASLYCGSLAFLLICFYCRLGSTTVMVPLVLLKRFERCSLSRKNENSSQPSVVDSANVLRRDSASQKNWGTFLVHSLKPVFRNL